MTLEELSKPKIDKPYKEGEKVNENESKFVVINSTSIRRIV